MKYPKCPKCKSADVGIILWGYPFVMPEYREEFDKELASGKTHLGGCLVTDNDPKWQCNNCCNKWGRRDD